MANNKSEARKLAREYFLTTDKSQGEIAALVGVNEKTLSTWKREEDWDIQKSATNITPRKTIAGLMLQLEELRISISDREKGKNFPTSSESDIIIKISKSIKMLQKSLTISDYMNAFEELTKFTLTTNADLAKKMISIMNEFIQVKSKELRES